MKVYSIELALPWRSSSQRSPENDCNLLTMTHLLTKLAGAIIGVLALLMPPANARPSRYLAQQSSSFASASASAAASSGENINF